MELIYKTEWGRILHGDNLEVLQKLPADYVDSCISDFPYGISFMGKKWDVGKGFYEWCYLRAVELIRVMKPGGLVSIFGHPKKNHRMKCAFEDAGFVIVEEIDWIYCSGMPKNQDIGKLFDKYVATGGRSGCDFAVSEKYQRGTVLSERFYSENGAAITKSLASIAKDWAGWKTPGLKPAHEPITIFQRPIKGTYIQNIKNYGCGAMNIQTCRVPMSEEDMKMLLAKASKRTTTNYAVSGTRIYGAYGQEYASLPDDQGRFPMNVIFDEEAADLFDVMTGTDNSRLFPVFKYQKKITVQKERELFDGTMNSHATLKPVGLIKWLIQLLTPLNGVTIDVTAGSCTHGVACELLNHEEGYRLTWVNIEMQNSEKEPYCEVGKKRVQDVLTVNKSD